MNIFYCLMVLSSLMALSYQTRIDLETGPKKKITVEDLGADELRLLAYQLLKALPSEEKVDIQEKVSEEKVDNGVKTEDLNSYNNFLDAFAVETTPTTPKPQKKPFWNIFRRSDDSLTFLGKRHS